MTPSNTEAVGSGDLGQRLATLTTEQKSRLLAALESDASKPLAASSVSGRLVAYVVLRAGVSLDRDSIKAHCQEKLPDYMVPQLFVELEAMPRTSAGKIDRNSLALQPTGAAANADAHTTMPRNDIEATLASIWAEVLGFEDISVDDDFFEVGGDSLLSIRILSRAAKAGLRIAPEDFFAHSTIAGQAKLAVTAGTRSASEQSAVGEFEILPIQRWFFDRIKKEPQHWNQSALLRLKKNINLTQIERVMQKLVAHHDGLRARFSKSDGAWRGQIDPPPATPDIEVVALEAGGSESVRASILSHANRVNASLELDGGPLLRVVIFESDGQPSWLLIVTHHLLIDAHSWRLLISDIDTALEQVLAGQAPALEAKSTSIREWSARLYEYARSEDFSPVADYWRNIVPDAVGSMPYDSPGGDGENNTHASATSITTVLDTGSTQALLQRVATHFRSKINDVLAASLARALAGWQNHGAVQFDMEGHGRQSLLDGLDVSRTVGWFTTVYPIYLAPSDAGIWARPLDALGFVKEQLSRMPLQGLGHGLLNLAPESAPVHSRQSKVLLNYLGQIDQLSEQTVAIELADPNCGAQRSPAGNRAYAIEINACITSEQLQMTWTFSTTLHSEATIKSLADSFDAALLELIELSDKSERHLATPTDFPLAGLDQTELDGLADMLDGLDDE